MAIIKCPACGKQITDRMEKCPHCDIILIQKQYEEPVTKETIKSSVKENMIGAAFAIVLTIVVEKIWGFITCIYAGNFMGMSAAEAVICAETIFYSKTLILLIVGAILFCVLSIFFKQKSATQFLIGIILTLLFCIIGFVMQNNAIMTSNISGDIIMYAKSLSLGFGFGIPMLLGGLSISSYERTIRKSLLMQVFLGVLFLVSSWIVGVLFLVVMHMGTSGLSLGSLVAAIIVLIVAVLTNKGFQRLITPKKIS